jgi:hypothetical protein
MDKIYRHVPFQDPPTFTQIGIFGLNMCHLATLIRTSEMGADDGERNYEWNM